MNAVRTEGRGTINVGTQFIVSANIIQKKGVMPMKDRINRELLRFFTSEVREDILNVGDSFLNDLQEIRVRTNRPVILKSSRGERVLEKKMAKSEVESIFSAVCENSIYAFQEDIVNGFVTVFGGHRIGIVGKALYKENRLYNIRDVSGLNFRIARQVIGAADKLIPSVIKNGEFLSTLLVAPPGLGKTTILRDLVRRISNAGYDVSLVDERSEIAAVYRGEAQNDVGLRTDVMDSVSKSEGIRMMVRSMRPDFIATDEIGTDEDAEAILYAVNSGVKILATAHGGSLEDLNRSTRLKELIGMGVFERIIVLKQEGFECVEKRKEN